MFTTHDINTISEKRLNNEFNRLAFAAVEKDLKEPRFEVADEMARAIFTLDVYPEGDRSLKYHVGQTEDDWLAYLKDSEYVEVNKEQVERIMREGVRYTLAISVSKLHKVPYVVTHTPEHLLTDGESVWEEVRAMYKEFCTGAIYSKMRDDADDMPF